MPRTGTETGPSNIQDRSITRVLQSLSKRKPTRCNRCLFLTISQHVSGIIMPIFRRTRRITACGVLRWFCWMWLVAVVGLCVVGCEHCEGYSCNLHVEILLKINICCILLVFSLISQFAHDARSQKPKTYRRVVTTVLRTSTPRFLPKQMKYFVISQD